MYNFSEISRQQGDAVVFLGQAVEGPVAGVLVLVVLVGDLGQAGEAQLLHDVATVRTWKKGGRSLNFLPEWAFNVCLRLLFARN